MTLGSFLTTAAYFVGGLVFWWAARRRRLDTEGFRLVALAGFVGGVIGAKLTEWIVAHWSTLTAQPLAILDPRVGGRTLIGGVLCGWLAVEIAKWRLGIRRSTGDLFALALPAGEAVGRVGCHFNGCCFGTPSALFFSVHQHDAWRHPAQLYSAGAAALLFGVLLLLRDRLPREGDLFKCYLVLYGCSRLLIEFFRERSIAFGGLSLAQWICLEIAVLGAMTLYFSRIRATRVLSTDQN